MKIAALWRYPVKGLSPEPLEKVELTTGQYFPGDRLYAIENGPSGFNPDAPEHQRKAKFLMLMRNEQLAKLKTRYDDSTYVLTIEHDGEQVCRADLSTPAGRSIVEQFFTAFLRHDLRGDPKVLCAPDNFRFTDSQTGFVSIINLASVNDLTRLVGGSVNPLRFRGNIYLEGLEPWAELALAGKILAIGKVRLKITKPIDRCAATNVDPVTGARDLNLPGTLMRSFGHVECGVYAAVAAGGTIRPGDQMSITE